MNRLIALVVFLPLGFLHAGEAKRTPLPTTDPAAGKLRVVTYNILGGRNTDGRRDLGRVAEVIKALNPDLIALQEVDVKTRRIKGVDVPAELAKLTGLKSAFAEAMPFDGGSYGEAALSRLEIVKQINHPLPHLKGHEPRAALELQVRVPGRTTPVVFIATHLDHLDKADDRRMQIAKLRELFTAKTLTGPGLLAGDLNATPDTAEIKSLCEYWQPTWPANLPGFTYPSDKPKIRIDYVLTQPDVGWKVVKTFRGNEVFQDDPTWIPLLQKASDHLPLVVELEWEAK